MVARTPRIVPSGSAAISTSSTMSRPWTVFCRFSRAALDPLDGAARDDREQGHDEVFGQDVQLAAEAAAHVGRDDAHVVLWEAEHLR